MPGFWALMSAKHLLAISIAAALLGLFAHRRRAKLVTGVCGLVVVLTASMGLWPTIALWRRVRQYDVPVSFTSILVPQVNGGTRQADRTVSYSTAADGSQLVLDVWRAQGVPDGEPRPAIVKVHGGAWNHGSRGDLAEWNKWFNGLGYDVFDVDYRMPPPVRWQDEVGDVKCALGWVVANASKYHVDTERISMIGYSAGGNLALLASYSMGDPQLPPSCQAAELKIRSVINIYGPTDMALLYRTTGKEFDVPAMMEKYIGGPPSEFAYRYKVLSPISHIDAHTPPTITVQGEADRVVPVEQAVVLDKALTAAGVYHETYYIPWVDHGFDANWGSVATQIARAKIKDFLARDASR